MTKLKDCNDGLVITRYPPSSWSESTDNDTDENENQQHGGQLSIQVESTGDLYWGGGTYLLTIHPDNNAAADSDDDSLSGSGSNGGFATLQSPLSGSFTYGYNAVTGEWVGNEDGHSMIGMFTRDWIRQCRGVPDF